MWKAVQVCTYQHFSSMNVQQSLRGSVLRWKQKVGEVGGASGEEEAKGKSVHFYCERDS